jgi:hypothetical protein
MASAPFQMAQNDIKSISNPARITAIGGDNATEFNLFFPFFPPGSQWVFPFTYGFMYVVDHPSYTAVKIDASQFPPGGQAPPVTTKIAQLTAYDTEQVFNPGIIAVGSSLIRWNLNSAPATGVQATATKAGSTGVTHVCDSYLACVSQSAANATTLSGNVNDGASNLILFTSGVSTTIGDAHSISQGPGLDRRGTPGSSMSIAWQSPPAGVFETVSLSGFDQ